MFLEYGKNLKLIFVVVLLSFLAATSLFPAVTQDQTVSVKEGTDYVMYYGSVDMNADSTGKFYTQWFYIHGLNQNSAYIAAYATDESGETEDINTFLKFAMKPDSTVQFSWTDEDTLNDMDQMTYGTTKKDTIDIDEGVTNLSYKTARYMRILFQGMSGNPDGTDVYWYVLFQKPENSTAWGGRGDRLAWYVANDAN